MTERTCGRCSAPLTGRRYRWCDRCGPLVEAERNREHATAYRRKIGIGEKPVLCVRCGLRPPKDGPFARNCHECLPLDPNKRRQARRDELRKKRQENMRVVLKFVHRELSEIMARPPRAVIHGQRDLLPLARLLDGLSRTSKTARR